jgi:hypothetical protein
MHGLDTAGAGFTGRHRRDPLGERGPVRPDQLDGVAGLEVACARDDADA